MNALFLGTPEDKSYLPHLKGMFGGIQTFVCLEPISLLTLLEAYCVKRSINKVVSTSTALLGNLLAREGKVVANPTLSDYAGSLFTYKHIEIVFVSPLAQLFSVPYGKFLCQRYISKVTVPEAWAESTEFKWAIVDSPSDLESAYSRFQSAVLIGIDIETIKTPLFITYVTYCALFQDPKTGKLSTESIVIKNSDEYTLAWIGKFNDLSAPKVFQNGKYDNSYFLRFNIPVRNWKWDTAHLFHSWYSELPKDLAFLNAFFLRKVVFWKDLAETSDPYEYARYNAMDGWATVNVLIQWILTAPDWARNNYTLEFPLVFPCLLAEMTGVPRDLERVQEARKQIDQEIEQKLSVLRTMVGCPSFNPNSSVQVLKLLKILGLKDADSSGEIVLKKAAFYHPLNALLCNLILDIRGLRKSASTYLRLESDAKQTGIHAGEGGAKEFKETILYALNPHGTDSGRLASREHHFWCGLQIQNVSSREGPQIKNTFKAADGFYIGECDLEQAETRDTAHISGDENLIAAATGEKDFHSINTSSFFGVPYEKVYDDQNKKVLDKKLRDLAKRVNHGANYNMGPQVLVETMGLDKIWEAKKLLKLPFIDPKEIASFLLERFHATYSKLRGPNTPYSPNTYYSYVVKEILVNKRLISRAFHHTEFNTRHYNPIEYIERGDWTRYCFGLPDKNKPDLNSYVSHGPQSLNARTLNEAWMKVFYEVALPNPETFRLHAQIHDSILFSYKEGYENHAEQVKECMEIPVTVKDISGTYRTFTVPAALKLGKMKEGKLIRAKYWGETE